MGQLAVEEVLYASPLKYLLIVLRGDGEATRQAFLSLQPNTQQLGDAHTGGALVGVIVSLQGESSGAWAAWWLLAAAGWRHTALCPVLLAPGDGERHDLYSRFFAPWAGIAEDPVTGSAHSILGAYWAKKTSKQQLRARQCSPRGGELILHVKRDEGRVVVAGQAVTVLTGHLLLPPA